TRISQDLSEGQGAHLPFQNLPNFQQQLRASNDATVVHVPLLVNWTELRDLINQGLQTTAEVQGPQRVTLLNPRLRKELSGMVVHQKRWLVITPPSPPFQTRTFRTTLQQTNSDRGG